MTGYYSHLPAGSRKASGTVKKKPIQRESKLQVRVAALLDKHMPPDIPWTAIRHGVFLSRNKEEARNRGAKMKREGLRKGWPDIHFLYRGKSIYIELKAGSSLKPEQKEVHTLLTLQGGVVKVCRNEAEVFDFLDVLGITLVERMTAAERAVLKARALAGA